MRVSLDRGNECVRLNGRDGLLLTEIMLKEGLADRGFSVKAVLVVKGKLYFMGKGFSGKVIVLFALMLLFEGCAPSKKLSSRDRAGIGATIGMWVGALFGRAVGSSIDDEDGGDIGEVVGAMAGGVAGAHIAYDKAEREKKAVSRVARSYGQGGMLSLPLLRVDDCFVDDVSGVILAGRESRLAFRVVNNGNSVARQVVPTVVIEKGGSRIRLAASALSPQDIPPRGEVFYSVDLAAHPRLRDGKAVVSVRLSEARGYRTEKRRFSLPTRRR